MLYETRLPHVRIANAYDLKRQVIISAYDLKQQVIISAYDLKQQIMISVCELVYKPEARVE